MKYKTMFDTMGEVKVPVGKYWGAQTQRSLENFKIGTVKMPREIIRAFAVLKKAAATANCRLGVLEEEQKRYIATVCDEIASGALDDHFPLSVYQTGSGTQTNMNVNEVIAGRGNELAGRELLHANDHVNKSQSSNDTFPTAMHIAAVEVLMHKLMPAVREMSAALATLEAEHGSIIKVGRTHLQDATPLTFGQEVGAWRAMLDESLGMIESALPGIMKLALGGTAVGTGLNAPEGFDTLATEEICCLTGIEFMTATNKFHALTSKDALTFSHGAIKALAVNLMKIANDVRWLASGPRCGIGEITIPENEPGSSIMPGKVNPTQCEALTMVCVQVMGNDATIAMAASQGNFQLNAYMPVLIHNYLESANLMADAINSFTENCVRGIKPNSEKMAENLKKSLMLVTALNPHIGYEKAARIAKTAFNEDITLKEAAVRLGLMTEATFDEAMDLNQMTHMHRTEKE